MCFTRAKEKRIQAAKYNSNISWTRSHFPRQSFWMFLILSNNRISATFKYALQGSEKHTKKFNILWVSFFFCVCSGRKGTLAAALLIQMNIFKCWLLSCILGSQVIACRQVRPLKLMRKNAVDLTRLHKHERFGTHSQSPHKGLTYPTCVMTSLPPELGEPH